MHHRKKIIRYLRHGLTPHNEQKRLQGQSNIPLAPEGIMQAQLVRQVLCREPIDQAFCSPLDRCQKTLAIATEGLAMPITIINELAELDIGHLSNLSYDEAAGFYPAEWNLFQKNPSKVVFPGGESFFDFQKRILFAYRQILDIVEEREFTSVLVVSHQRVIQALVASLMGIDLDFATSIQIENCSTTIIEYTPENSLSLVKSVNIPISEQTISV